MPAPNRFVTARLQIRKGTTEEWQLNDPVLMNAEPAWDTKQNKIKFGDGKSKWSELPYVQNLGGPGMWSNDNSGLFPSWVTSQQDAVDYVMFSLGQLADHGPDDFDAGLGGHGYTNVHTLNITAGTGGFASIDGEPRPWNNYDQGQVVAITATPLANYAFLEWNGEVANSTSAQTTVTMSKDQSVMATFLKL